ncbi:hypothetical protein ILYODFUR_002564 [Ilyodon furcidens]|uniref:Uncharacterized protein n=1 Tax=Ilyodon furcidens TaxID=33524 RepID=A0ABV0TFG6_9TELE
MSPTSPGIWSKLSRRWDLNTSLAEGSARRSQQTLTMRLGLPSLSGFLLLQRIQLRQTFPADPHYALGPAKSVRLSPPPAHPTHHQVVISGQLSPSLHPSVQNMRPKV